MTNLVVLSPSLGELTHPDIDYTPHYGIEKNIGIGTTGIQISGTTSGLDGTFSAQTPEDTILFSFGSAKSRSCIEKFGGEYFGWSVAAGSERIVVGSPQDDDNGTDSGSVGVASVYYNNGTSSWEYTLTKIVPSDGDDNFGDVVAVGDNKIVVGCKNNRSNQLFSFKWRNRDSSPYICGTTNRNN